SFADTTILWRAYEVALGMRTAVPKKRDQLFRLLNPFGGGLHSKFGGEKDRCFDDRQAVCRYHHFSNEALVNFDAVKGKFSKIAQRRVAGAEIVQGDRYAHRLEPFERSS